MAQNTLPAALNVPASELFEGVDGNWSTFNISLGSNGQIVRLLPSISLTEAVVVDSGNCPDGSLTNCSSVRGGVFDISQSTTWQPNQNLSVANTPALDSNQFVSQFGFDTISIPVANQKPTSMANQLIGSGNATANLLELGFFPLSAGTTTLPGVAAIPSFLTNLKGANLIPGIGYGFTAGASYLNAPGSLVLGGYDTSRYTSNDLTFTFGPDGIGQLQVGIQQIVYSDTSGTGNKQSLLIDGGIFALIDSTIPEMWLPLGTCGAIAKAFNLKFVSNILRYTIDDDARKTNLKNNPNVTITIGNAVDSGATVDIVLPYSAFDLLLEPPIVFSDTRYFPLRQALNPKQYTLGRVFLQEAYVRFDFEKGNFNVYQAAFLPGQQHILPITAENSTGSTGTQPTGSSPAPAGPTNTGIIVTKSGGGLPSSAVAGIAIGVCLLAAILAGIAVWCFWKKRRDKRRDRARAHTHAELSAVDQKGYFGSPANHDTDSQYTPGHSQKPSVTASEADSHAVGQRQSRIGTDIREDTLVELDEGAPRGEMDSLATTSPQRNPRLGNFPTYIEMPSPAYSQQSNLPSPPTESISGALSQPFHSTRQSPQTSPADEMSSQISQSAFQSPMMTAAAPKFGPESPVPQLSPSLGFGQTHASSGPGADSYLTHQPANQSNPQSSRQ